MTGRLVPMTPLRGAAVALLAALSLSGCAGLSLPGGDAAPADSPAASQPVDGTHAELPEGSQWADVPGLDAKFAVPKDWSVVRPETLVSSPEKAPVLIAELANRGPVGVAEFGELLTQQSGVELVAVGPQSVSLDEVESIEVQVVPEMELPNEGQAQQFLDQNVGLLEEGVSEVVHQSVGTGLGEGVRMDYFLDIIGQEGYSSMVMVPVEGQTVIVQVRVSDAGERDAVAGTVVGTLSKRD